MKENSNLIDTKDEIINNFTEEQKRIYEYYKNQFSYPNNELYPIEKDKEILVLEKSYKVLKTVLKFETVLVLIIITIMCFVNGFPNNKASVKYKSAIVNTESFNDEA